MTYPDTRLIVFDMIDGRDFAGHTVRAFYRLQPGPDGKIIPGSVLVYPLGGTESQIDRTDRIGVDVYAIGTDSQAIAEAIRDLLVPGPHETYHIDDVAVETTPADVPYADPDIQLTQAIYRLTCRPL